MILLVAEYIDRRNAFSLMRVCRAWNHVFSCTAWQSLALNPIHTLPPLDLIKRNAHHIQELFFEGDLPLGYYDLPCTNVLKLQIDYIGQTDPKAWIFISMLLSRNSKVHKIVVCDKSYSASSLFWSTFARCPSLKTVAICDAKMDSNDIREFWKGCYGVKILVVTGLRLDCSPTQPFFGSELGVFPCLEHIYVSLEDKSRFVDTEVVLARCPKLTGCFLNEGYRGNDSGGDGGSDGVSRSSRSSRSSSYDTDSTTEAAVTTVPTLEQIFQEQRLLDSRQLCIGSEVKFEDAELSSYLDAMDEMTMLTVDRGDFGHLSFRSLVSHFDSLQRVLLERCFGVTGAMVQRILESCPMLIEISAPRIEATQIMTRKRWSCLGLRAFKVCIVLDSTHHSIGVQSRMVYVQLARLTQLQHLDIAADRGKGIQGLDLRLASGLYQLSTLSTLCTLRYSGTRQLLSKDDVLWMREHWKLKTYPPVQQAKAQAKK